MARSTPRRPPVLGRPACKLCGGPGVPTYRLVNADVVVCTACGFHYTTHLDDAPAATASAHVSDRARHVIERGLHSDPERHLRHLARLEQYRALRGLRLLDVGSGGGLFLHAVRQAGASAVGIEIDPARVRYARERYGLDVVPHLLGSAHWDAHVGTFGAVTLWDVLEHVNDPVQTLRDAAAMLAPGGVLLFDTPMRDGAFHRLSEHAYRLTGGRVPAFLDILYSDHPYGHKQIFSRADIRRALALGGMEVRELEALHELSFPVEHYVRLALRSRRAARLLTPAARAAIRLLRVRNKMVGVAQKPPPRPPAGAPKDLSGRPPLPLGPGSDAGGAPDRAHVVGSGVRRLSDPSDPRPPGLPPP